jgi:predicted nucleic acid-binding protein
MSDKIFLDTNIFVYSIDSAPREKRKRDIARNIIKENIQNESGVISIQVMQEFYQVVTRKIQTPLTLDEAYEFLNYISILETVKPDFALLVAAIMLQKKYRLSFWDVLILQAAKTAGCELVYSEDFQDGMRLEGMTIKNPFKTSIVKSLKALSTRR